MSLGRKHRTSPRCHGDRRGRATAATLLKLRSQAIHNASAPGTTSPSTAAADAGGWKFPRNVIFCCLLVNRDANDFLWTVFTFRYQSRFIILAGDQHQAIVGGRKLGCPSVFRVRNFSDFRALSGISAQAYLYRHQSRLFIAVRSNTHDTQLRLVVQWYITTK